AVRQYWECSYVTDLSDRAFRELAKARMPPLSLLSLRPRPPAPIMYGGSLSGPAGTEVMRQLGQENKEQLPEELLAAASCPACGGHIYPLLNSMRCLRCHFTFCDQS